MVKGDDGQLGLPGIGSIAEDRYGHKDRIGLDLGLPGAGPLAVMTKDQLHPMMVFDQAMWSSGSKWLEGARQHVRQAAELCEIKCGELVLDVGSGLGGPSRMLADEFGADVYELNLVMQHLTGSRGGWVTSGIGGRGVHVQADAMRLPFRQDSVDVVWSMNMAYHLSDKGAFLGEACRVLKHGGRLMLDDWIFTDQANNATVETMEKHFGSGDLFSLTQLIPDLYHLKLHVRRYVDLGGVGRTLMDRYVREVVERDFLHKMEAIDPTWGKTTGLDFVDSIESTVELYRNEQMTYIQLVAVKT